MPNQTLQRSGDQFSSRVLSMPHSGMGGVVLKPGERLEFSFDPSDVTFSRAGSDLVITGNHGSGRTLSGFFVAKNVDALPQFILPGGDNVPASAYLQNLNIDITTAAGPARDREVTLQDREKSAFHGPILTSRAPSIPSGPWVAARIAPPSAR